MNENEIPWHNIEKIKCPKGNWMVLKRFGDQIKEMEGREYYELDYECKCCGLITIYYDLLYFAEEKKQPEVKPPKKTKTGPLDKMLKKK